MSNKAQRVIGILEKQDKQDKQDNQDFRIFKSNSKYRKN